MTIYVDSSIYKYGRMIMCHMISDISEEELHTMADKIGIERKHFQNGGRPHYDICKSRRALAVMYGAKEISSMALVKILKRRK